MTDVADAYEGSADTDVVFVALVEQGLADGWRSWPITRSAADAAAVMRLQRMIADRRQARVPADLVEAERAIAELMPGTVEARIRLLRDGKLRVATRQTTAA